MYAQIEVYLTVTCSKQRRMDLLFKDSYRHGVARETISAITCNNALRRKLFLPLLLKNWIALSTE